jgi:poly-gamma-glutamate synthesis protein (capsule biosynthesis protein)
MVLQPVFPWELASVRLLAVGDIMMHQDIKVSAGPTAAGLSSLWAGMEPLIHGADLVFANLETPVAPVTGQPGRPFQFNAPMALPAALKQSGFTVLATANNHAYDQGVKGVVETLERLRAEGLVPVGTGVDRADAERTRIVTVNGLRLAFMGFTDLFNVDLNRGDDQPWVRPLDPAAAEAAVRQARPLADVVVVSIHWGTEYSHQPTGRQRAVAARLAAAGADLILGHHPHALQPVERIVSGSHQTLVAYSMGNFISNQDRMYRADLFPVTEGDSRDGVALQCRMVKQRLADGSERVLLEDPVCEPLWTFNNWREFTSGRAKVREIQVTPVDAAMAATRTELDRLRSAAPADPDAVKERQALLDTLTLRRQRAGETLGAAFVAR